MLVVSSSTFPEIIGQTYRKAPIFTSLTSGTDGAGDERVTFDGPAYRFTLGWSALDLTNAGTLLRATQFLAGPWGRMWFWEWRTEAHTYTVTATATDTYTLPAKNVTDLTATVDGVTRSCTISVNTGDNGEDQAVLASATTAGQTVIFTFTGRYLRRVRMEGNDLRLTDKPNDAGVWQGTLTLVEVGA